MVKQSAHFRIVLMCGHQWSAITTLFVFKFIVQWITVEIYLKPQKDSIRIAISRSWPGLLLVWKDTAQKGEIDPSVTVPLSLPSFIDESRQNSGAT